MLTKNLVKNEKSTFEKELEELEAKVQCNESLSRPQYVKEQDFLSFLQIEVDCYDDQNSSMIHIFGVTENENTVAIHIRDYEPYFYFPAPSGFIPEVHLELLKNCLNHEMSKSSRFGVKKLDYTRKASIYGFEPVKNILYIQVVCSTQSACNAAKKIVENTGFSFGDFPFMTYPTFESNIPFVMRFMIDCKLSGMCWIQIKNSDLKEVAVNMTSCQLEYEVEVSKIHALSPDGIWSKVPPLRILSYDIECTSEKNTFPEADKDPVIQIACVLSKFGSTVPFYRTVFSLRKCAPISGAIVESFDTEYEMLSRFSKFVQLADPDFVTGYNILNFDFPYLLERAKVLGVEDFDFLGRLLTVKTRAKDSIFSSKAYGTRESKVINLDGRVVFDLIQVIQRDYKLRSYSLNSVSSHFLNEQKEDVPHSIIPDLFNGNEETRRRLAVYCLKDAYLPIRIMDRIMCLYNYIEMARVTGVPFNYLLSRGQQVKVISQLYRKAIDENFLIPSLKIESTDEQYEGATVIEPEKGFYNLPIATLDFASLYPSIMMAHNLCYSTLLDSSKISSLNLSSSDYTITPSGDYFVKAHIRKGVLPSILEDLISARKKAKAELKNETDLIRKACLDGRQLALKISANSVYGFTGATIGKLPCIQISQSVTAFGRQMIEMTKHEVEQRYTKENGYTYDARVVYGDTDSVMIKFGPEDLEEVMKLGKDAAVFVSSKFSRPIALEFEKCYYPYLLINKKRYAGLYWTKTDKYDKLDTKGLETVRRDNCRLVQTVVDTCLKKILIDRDVEAAKDYAKSIISDLLQNKIDLYQLVISKALSKSGDEYAGKQAHVELAEKMRKRDAGSAPTLGDRVAYVIVKSSKGAAAYEKAEDPIYVLENNIPIDTKYYLENQLSKPLMRIFEPVLNRPEELLSGDHTRIVQISAPTSGAMSKFTVKRETCHGCKATLKEGTILLCEHCKPRFAEIYLETLSKSNEIERKYSKLWTQCQTCQGSIHQDIICTNSDCPIFYMRKKAQKDVVEANMLVKSFYDYK